MTTLEDIYIPHELTDKFKYIISVDKYYTKNYIFNYDLIIDKDDKIGDITKELIYLISQEEGCSYKEFGLSKEIIEILIEILIISNTDSIKENFREFLKSNLFFKTFSSHFLNINFLLYYYF
jgi:hypothetical protein